MMQPTVGRITIYPIKSLDGIDVQEIAVTQGGALQHDRTYALYNSDGRTVNGKKYPAIHKIRTFYDLENQNVTISHLQEKVTLNLETDQMQIEEWFSDYFKEKVILKKDATLGFPDDDVANGPTIIAAATWNFLHKKFPEMEIAELCRRFRANIEIANVTDPFWEDHLFDKPGTKQPFKIGGTQFFGTNPCARCVVPTRNPETGEVTQNFARNFMQLRKENLSSFSNPEQFDHFNRLTVNTLIDPQSFGTVLRLNDTVTF